MNKKFQDNELWPKLGFGLVTLITLGLIWMLALWPEFDFQTDTKTSKQTASSSDLKPNLSPDLIEHQPLGEASELASKAPELLLEGLITKDQQPLPQARVSLLLSDKMPDDLFQLMPRPELENYLSQLLDESAPEEHAVRMSDLVNLVKAEQRRKAAMSDQQRAKEKIIGQELFMQSYGKELSKADIAFLLSQSSHGQAAAQNIKTQVYSALTDEQGFYQIMADDLPEGLDFRHVMVEPRIDGRWYAPIMERGWSASTYHANFESPKQFQLFFYLGSEPLKREISVKAYKDGRHYPAAAAFLNSSGHGPSANQDSAPSKRHSRSLAAEQSVLWVRADITELRFFHPQAAQEKRLALTELYNGQSIVFEESMHQARLLINGLRALPTDALVMKLQIVDQSNGLKLKVKKESPDEFTVMHFVEGQSYRLRAHLYQQFKNEFDRQHQKTWVDIDFQLSNLHFSPGETSEIALPVNELQLDFSQWQPDPQDKGLFVLQINAGESNSRRLEIPWHGQPLETLIIGSQTGDHIQIEFQPKVGAPALARGHTEVQAGTVATLNLQKIPTSDAS